MDGLTFSIGLLAFVMLWVADRITVRRADRYRRALEDVKDIALGGEYGGDLPETRLFDIVVRVDEEIGA